MTQIYKFSDKATNPIKPCHSKYSTINEIQLAQKSNKEFKNDLCDCLHSLTKEQLRLVFQEAYDLINDTKTKENQ